MVTTIEKNEKKATEKTPKKKRSIRTPEQIVADLQQEILRVQARAAAKEAKSAPEGKPFMAAVKAVDKAMEAAQGAENAEMQRALESARAALSAHLIEMGVRAPETRRRNGEVA